MAIFLWPKPYGQKKKKKKKHKRHIWVSRCLQHFDWIVPPFVFSSIDDWFMFVITQRKPFYSWVKLLNLKELPSSRWPLTSLQVEPRKCFPQHSEASFKKVEADLNLSSKCKTTCKRILLASCPAGGCNQHLVLCRKRRRPNASHCSPRHVAMKFNGEPPQKWLWT